MSARDDYPRVAFHAQPIEGYPPDIFERDCAAALDEIDRLRDLFNFVGTWCVRHADGTTEDIELTHGNLVENNVGTCGQFILRLAIAPSLPGGAA